MEYKKYQHVERYGQPEVVGIEKGTCWVFPKIDGSNGCVWLGDDGVVKAGGRNRELSETDNNRGFYGAVTKDERFAAYFNKHPDHILYGEWLIPHTLRNYQDSAWRKFYVFDVFTDGDYVPYEQYKGWLEEFGIEYIPLIKSLENPDYEQLVECLEHNGFLTSDGENTGEGIVIKNYDYRNKEGLRKWAKIVSAEFREKHDSHEEETVEQRILFDYVTSAFIEKEFAKLTQDCEWSPKMTPQLFNTVFHVLIQEEIWNILKKYKNPTINFSMLNYLVIKKIKEVKSDIFKS